jgi:hypothetical protein
MNGEPSTELIQLITRTGSLSGDADLAPARPTLIRRHWAIGDQIVAVSVVVSEARQSLRSRSFMAVSIALRVNSELRDTQTERPVNPVAIIPERP